MAIAELSPGTFLVAVAVAAAASMAVFAHADKQGNRHATAWGIGVFLLAGVVLPLYVLRCWLRSRRAR